MSGEDLLHQFFDDAREWLVQGGVHYRPCPHVGYPHHTADEPCLWMSPEANHAFLAWAVKYGYVAPARADAYLGGELLQASSALADVALRVEMVPSDHAVAHPELISHTPLVVLLVGLGVGWLLAQCLGRRTG
jgi:hypothetical protein